MDGASNTSGGFGKDLVGKNLIAGDVIAKFDARNVPGSGQPLRRLWELTDLSANDFADEVARFHGIARMSLAQLMEASAIVGRFSPRFLREMSVFPFETADGQ